MENAIRLPAYSHRTETFAIKLSFRISKVMRNQLGAECQSNVKSKMEKKKYSEFLGLSFCVDGDGDGGDIRRQCHKLQRVYRQ